MAFDAAKVAAKLDWSFRPYHDFSGTVPEPTDDEMDAMNAKLKEAMALVGGADFDPTDQASVIKAFNALSMEDLRKMQDDQMDALLIVTKSSPSREVLTEVGPRLRRHFSTWLLGELNGAEGSATATKR